MQKTKVDGTEWDADAIVHGDRIWLTLRDPLLNNKNCTISGMLTKGSDGSPFGKFYAHLIRLEDSEDDTDYVARDKQVVAFNLREVCGR